MFNLKWQLLGDAYFMVGWWFIDGWSTTITLQETNIDSAQRRDNQLPLGDSGVIISCGKMIEPALVARNSERRNPQANQPLKQPLDVRSEGSPSWRRDKQLPSTTHPPQRTRGAPPWASTTEAEPMMAADHVPWCRRDLQPTQVVIVAGKAALPQWLMLSHPFQQPAL